MTESQLLVFWYEASELASVCLKATAAQLVLGQYRCPEPLNVLIKQGMERILASLIDINLVTLENGGRSRSRDFVQFLSSAASSAQLLCPRFFSSPPHPPLHSF
jgi:hypothetical protein